ncbi:hypothetical protein Q9Q95_14135 [Sphingomonas sp. DG1-23]|nr:hypothetical protein [Sphingomonas sp. DG1-23]
MWQRETSAAIPLLIMFGAHTAFAQEASQPPKEYGLDSNGMDLANGRFSLPGPRLEIGTNDSGLSHTTIGSPVHNGQVTNYVDNYSNSIWTAPGPSWGDPGGPVFASVSFDGVTRMFMVGNWIDHASTQTFYSSPYPGDGPEKLVCPDGITASSGTCTLLTADGGSVVYDLAYNSPMSSFSGKALRGMATRINRSDGEVIRINYTALQKKTVWSSLGWMLKYVYASTGDLSAIYSYNTSETYCNPDAASCALNPAYPNLIKETQGNTRIFYRNNVPVYKYDYTSDGEAVRYDPLWDKVSFSAVSSVSDSNGLRRKFSVKRGGSEWIYTKYYWTEYPPYYREIVLEWDISNPKGQSRHVNVNRDSQVASITDELQRKTIYRREEPYSSASPRPKYILPSPITFIIPPQGSGTAGKTEFQYELGKVSEVKRISRDSSDLPLVTKLTYGCSSVLCASKPTEIKDPAGNVTKYDYSAEHGLLEKETGPADASGVNPQKRYFYEQRYPKVRNASGVLVNAEPVWRLVRVSQCLTATKANPASCVGTGDELVTSYAYDNNNLLRTAETVASGDGVVSATTSFTYDTVGNVIVVDGPRAGIDDRKYTTYDSLRRPVLEIGGDPDGSGGNPRSITKHHYDTVGREFLTEFGVGVASDGSDFTVQRFTRMSFDPSTGEVIKREVGHK